MFLSIPCPYPNSILLWFIDMAYAVVVGFWLHRTFRSVGNVKFRYMAIGLFIYLVLLNKVNAYLMEVAFTTYSKTFPDFLTLSWMCSYTYPYAHLHASAVVIRQIALIGIVAVTSVLLTMAIGSKALPSTQKRGTDDLLDQP